MYVCTYTHKIDTHANDVWSTSWSNFCRRYNSSESLINFVPNCKSLLSNARIPTNYETKLTGQLCSLISGHSNLNAHLFRLGLTLTPLCACSEGDETPLHYLFECKLYESDRVELQPSPPNWLNILQFIKKTKRLN